MPTGVHGWGSAHVLTGHTGRSESAGIPGVLMSHQLGVMLPVRRNLVELRVLRGEMVVESGWLVLLV
jgi:hypothetical protein